MLGWMSFSAIALHAQTTRQYTPEQLQAAICQNDWGTAIQTLNHMMGDETLSASDRQRLLDLRHQLSDYQLHQTQFDFSASPQCQALVSQAPEATSAAPPASTPIDWNRAAQSIQQRSRRQPTTTSSQPASQRTAAAPTAPQCPTPPPEGDREVASGSISSRWSYEIYQNGSNNQFYAQYWRQNDCSQVYRMPTLGELETQNEVYQNLRAYLEAQAY